MNNNQEINQPSTKICKCCKIRKSFNEFNKNVTKKYGLTSACILCERSRKKKIREERRNKEKLELEQIINKYNICDNNERTIKNTFIKKSYVYILIDPRNNEPFYVGKGNRRRFKAHFEPNRLLEISPKNSKIKKILSEGLNVIVKIHTNNLSNNEACELEIELIKQYGRVDIGTGILLNRSIGGDSGLLGRKVTQEVIEKIKKTKSLRTYTWYDKTKKMASLISPKGILYNFTGIEEFIKQHNLCNAIRDVINGKTRQYKGWTSPDFIEYWKSKEHPYMKVLSPNGIVFTFNRISEFCRTHNLSISHLSQVLKCERKSHKGWRLPV